MIINREAILLLKLCAASQLVRSRVCSNVRDLFTNNKNRFYVYFYLNQTIDITHFVNHFLNPSTDTHDWLLNSNLV